MALSKVKILKETEEESPEEASSAEESETGNQETEAQIEVNGGWADAIAKVLSTTKPKSKKTLVLSRAKKVKHEPIKQKSEKEEFGFEVAESVVKVEEKTVEKSKIKSINNEADEKDVKPKNLKLKLRVRPTWKDIERERSLRKVATKGVVQLFNAVRIQQKELQQNLEEAGPLDSRRDAVLNSIDKRKFLDVLMSGNRAKSENVDGVVKKEEDTSSSSSEEEEYDDDKTTRKKKKKWSVLEPDFLTNKKAKHWDEEDNEDEPDLRSSGDESENN